MDKLVIEGGIKLTGEVFISGSKNATLPVLAACLLSDKDCKIANIPALEDVHSMVTLFEHLGVTVERTDDKFTINAADLNSVEATYDIVRKMRASVLVMGPLVARFGRARVSYPGGCAIGARPIDIHLKGLEAMGAVIELTHGYIEAKAPVGGLCGAEIVLDLPSVTATENLMMAACLAKGVTEIKNAALEPEIIELAEALQSMGAKINGAGTDKITIVGQPSLGSMNYTVGPDRIESGTFIAVAAITGGDIVLRNVRVDQLRSTIAVFKHLGCEMTVLDSANVADKCQDLRVVGPKKLQSIDIATAPYPGFATDMQAQLMACLSVADGISHVEETIFENRFMHVLEMLRMGADISMNGNLAVVTGVNHLSGAPVMATDLRASAGLVIAALKAEGISEILRIYHLDRGYVHLEEKLIALGAKVTRVRES
ncbi:MAG: UDP-N-acetylglucosamine 1-carboxyvinyltransferase [bacterium]|nr:UDP-N-acetylglucosamine 1-carboxyvinyltransferase [bacterium]